MKKSKPAYGILSNIRWMLSLAREHGPTVPAACTAIAAVAVGQSLLNLFAPPAILAAVQAHDSLARLLVTIGGFTLGTMLLRGISAYLEDTTLYPRIDIRRAIISQINHKKGTTSYPNTEDPTILSQEKRVRDATDGNREATEHIWLTLAKLAELSVCFAVSTFLLTALHPAILAVTAVTSTVGFFIRQHFQSWGYRHREEQAELGHAAGYSFKLAHKTAFAKDIRIFSMIPWLKEVYRKAVKRLWDFYWRERRAYFAADLIEVGLNLLRSGFAYAVLIRMALEQNLSAPGFVLYFSAVTGFSSWLDGILDQVLRLRRESLELSQVREFLDLPEPFRMEGGAPIPVEPGKAPSLRLEHVSFRYPGAKEDTIHDLSVTLHPGEKLAVVGENGAGKTTLVKLLCGLYDPTEGRVLLNGQDIRTFNRPEYYRLFSAVFQEIFMLDVTLRENITQTQLSPDDNRLRQAIERAGLTEKVNALGLEAHLGHTVFEDGVELSGGEMQRLALARALYKDGPILVLDEPTAALDPIAESDIYQKYNAMTSGKTSLFISHRLASTRFCDRILLLDHGTIAEEGTHETLLAAGGAYADMFNLQKKYYQEGAVL